MNKVDVIAIMYDASDYQNRRPVYNEGNQDELVTYVGSLRSSFKLLQEKYPWVRIVFMSPTYMLHKEENGIQKVSERFHPSEQKGIHEDRGPFRV